MSSTDSGFHDFWDRYNEVVEEVIDLFRTGVHKVQPWTVVSAARLKKIWHDTRVTGFVRDVKGLEMISHQILTNITLLMANTVLMGHTGVNPRDEFDLTPEECDSFADYAIDENGQFRLSDYGMDRLVDLAAKIYQTKKPEDKLVLLDQVLNVTHQRSDLASWFVEGGTKSLHMISGEGLA